jgi:MFS family permease
MGRRWNFLIRPGTVDGMAVVKRLPVLVGAIVLVDTMFYAALTPLLPHYASELGLSKAGAGLLAGAYAVGALAGVLPSAMLASRFGVKPTILVGLGGMIVTTALFGFADTEWLLDSARFLQGFASSCSWTAGLAWLVADAPADSRGRLIGSAMGAAIFGAMLGPVIGGIASVTSTEVTFGGVACLGFVLAAAAATTPSLHAARRQPISLLFGSLRSGRMVASIWFIAVPAFAFGTMNVLGPLRLHVLGLGAVAIGAIWLTGAGLEATAAPFVGHLSDRRGRLLPLSGGLIAAGVLFALFPLLDAHWWLFAPAIIACSFALGAFWAPAMSLASDESERLGLDYAFGFALISLAWAPAQIGGAAGGGALADATSDAVPYLVLAALCALTLAALWRSARSL